MATIKFFLDIRRLTKDNTASLKIAVRNNRTTTFIPTGVMLNPKDWDKKNGRVLPSNPQYKNINSIISKRKGEIEVTVLNFYNNEGIGKQSAIKLKNKILRYLNPELYSEKLFYDVLKEFLSLKKESTKGVYIQTISRINSFTNIENLEFKDITPEWLNKFDKHLSVTAPSKNARNIHLRNIRAIFNFAINNEYTSLYPFRKYKIRPEQTRKRALSVEDLQIIFNYDVEPYAEIYRDIFKLIFMLIGINTIDLYGLKEVHKGRIEYKRAKTGRLYSIKVEPEAMEIINKYQGIKGLLSITDRWDDYRNFRKQTNKALQRIGDIRREGKGGKKIITPLFPELTTYWARHTWATIAAELDIPDAVISQALGHAGENTTTDIYIKRSQRKVDEANRRVLDWVLYGKN